jgi:hypothetical protein
LLLAGDQRLLLLDLTLHLLHLLHLHRREERTHTPAPLRLADAGLAQEQRPGKAENKEPAHAATPW